jgi:hypothetical protein
LFDAHEERLGGVRGEEGVDGVEHVVEVGILVDGAVVHDEFVVGLDAEADVEGADAGVELGGEDGGGGAEVLWGAIALASASV